MPGPGQNARFEQYSGKPATQSGLRRAGRHGLSPQPPAEVHSADHWAVSRPREEIGRKSRPDIVGDHFAARSSTGIWLARPSSPERRLSWEYRQAGPSRSPISMKMAPENWPLVARPSGFQTGVLATTGWVTAGPSWRLLSQGSVNKELRISPAEKGDA
jgi:hypothetical protein